MGKGKKNFIDRKKAVTFHLVHRSQHDPLITDETAPQHVLLEATPKNQKDSTNKSPEEDKVKQKEAQRKFGVYFDDDYNYLQHLKEPSKDTVVWEVVDTPNQQKVKKEKPIIQLPSSVFETEFEEDVGMLNKAAPRPGPRPDWDPDIVAALDDDFDYEDPDNIIEDDFVLKAMEGEDDDDDDDDYFDEDDEYEDGDISSDNLGDHSDDEDELMDRLAPLQRKDRFNDEETKSRFTEYSMSSSVIRRNEQLALLDDRFEQFYATYDDIEVGPLDTEDIEGKLATGNKLVRMALSEMKKGEKVENYSKNWDSERIKKFEKLHENGSDDEIVEVEVEKDKKKWDCESILSTYSNIYNHPKLIEEKTKRARKSQKIEINPKTGLPVNVLNGNETTKLTTKTLSKFDNQNDEDNDEHIGGPKSLCAKSILSTLSVLSLRPKDETPEEKRERKRLLKEYRTERRFEKKANADAFKEEKKRQTHIKINNQNNIQGNKIV